MALRIASLLFAISPALITGQDFVVGSSDSGACIGSYCCDGSLIGGTGNSNDASDFTCCLGDPNHGIINGVPDTTCSAGSAVPLTAATGSVATASITRTSAASSSTQAASDDFSDDSIDSSTSITDDASATTTAASSAMISSTNSQHITASSSSTPTSFSSDSALTSSESASAGATSNAAVEGCQFSIGQAAVGLLALGYNIAL